MGYCIFLIKSTRKPVLIDKGPSLSLPLQGAMNEADEWGSKIKALFDKQLCSSGISAQVIAEKDLEAAEAVQIGGLSFAGISVLYAVGNY